MKPLCYRCEYRARFLENGTRPRFECGEIDSAVNGCYMFKPVKPMILKRRDGDKRPVTLNILSGRVEGVGVPEDIELRDMACDKPLEKGHSSGILPMWVKPN